MDDETTSTSLEELCLAVGVGAATVLEVFVMSLVLRPAKTLLHLLREILVILGNHPPPGSPNLRDSTPLRGILPATSQATHRPD